MSSRKKTGFSRSGCRVKYSPEQKKITGTFAGIACVDGLCHNNYADFDFFEMTE